MVGLIPALGERCRYPAIRSAMTDVAKFILYPLSILMAISLAINVVAQRWDWENILCASGIILFSVTTIALINLRIRSKRRKWLERVSELQGLEKCPISSGELRELFEFLDRPNPPECRRRLYETHDFLESRNLEIEGMLEWLHANGAKCDCEVIMNTSDRYGSDVGFSTVDESANAG